MIGLSRLEEVLEPNSSDLSGGVQRQTRQLGAMLRNSNEAGIGQFSTIGEKERGEARAASGKGARSIEEAEQGPQGSQLRAVIGELRGAGKQARKFNMWVGFVRAVVSAWLLAPLCEESLLGLEGLQGWAEQWGRNVFHQAAARMEKDLRGRLLEKKRGQEDSSTG